MTDILDAVPTPLKFGLTHTLEKKWIAALRSGEYKQTTGTLCRNGPLAACSFCCLGVLAQVLVKEGHMLPDQAGNESVLPYDLAIARYGDNHPLVAWNDNESQTFEDIARRIENGDVYTERRPN